MSDSLRFMARWRHGIVPSPRVLFSVLLVCGILATALNCCGCSGAPTGSGEASSTGDREVMVFAAASLTNAMDDIKTTFSRRTGITVLTNYAGSSTLAQQIAHGAPADIFLSANVSWADYIQEHASVRKRCDVLGNRLVVVVPTDSRWELRAPVGLLAPELRHLALADPDAVPAGRYARQALTRLGLWQQLQPRVVPGKDVRQALAYVETGAAEAGIVYATDAAVTDKVRIAWEIPVEMTDPVIYPGLLLEQPIENEAAAVLFDFLISDEGRRIFESYGFVALGPSEQASPSTSGADGKPRER